MSIFIQLTEPSRIHYNIKLHQNMSSSSSYRHFLLSIRYQNNVQGQRLRSGITKI